jgi:hypothetical protein
MVSKTKNALSASERKDARRRSAPGVAIVYEAIRQEAETELSRPNAALFWSGLAAGLSMGFSFIAEALLLSGLPDAPWQHLVSKLGYSVGFLIVILGRQQLFTENTLTPVLQVLQSTTLSALKNTLRLWGVVLCANLVGTLAFAFTLSTTSIVDAGSLPAFASIATHALDGGFWNTRCYHHYYLSGRDSGIPPYHCRIQRGFLCFADRHHCSGCGHWRVFHTDPDRQYYRWRCPGCSD